MQMRDYAWLTLIHTCHRIDSTAAVYDRCIASVSWSPNWHKPVYLSCMNVASCTLRVNYGFVNQDRSNTWSTGRFKNVADSTFFFLLSFHYMLFSEVRANSLEREREIFAQRQREKSVFVKRRQPKGELFKGELSPRFFLQVCARRVRSSIRTQLCRYFLPSATGLRIYL